MSELIPVKQIEAEISLLGGCLIEGLSPAVAPDAFTLDRHRLVAQTLIEMDRERVPIDLVTVGERLLGRIPMADLAGLTTTVPDARNVETYARIVREFAAARRLQFAAANYLTAVNGRHADIKELVSGFVAEVVKNADPESSNSREQTAKQAIAEFIPTLMRRYETPGLSGISTGIRKLDQCTTGLCPGDLLILAARPSMGKTALALNIALFTASQGIPTLFVSLEMSTQQVVSRIASCESGVPLSAIRSGEGLRGPWFSMANEAAVTISEWPLTFVDCGCSELDIVRKSVKYRPKIVLVDYLQLVRPSVSKGSANYDYGAVCKVLKGLATDQEIPVVLLCQLNRSAAKEKRQPRLDDLRDSGEIEQDADMVLFIHADNHMTDDRELILAKNRQGETALWGMRFNRKIQRFEDLE